MLQQESCEKFWLISKAAGSLTHAHVHMFAATGNTPKARASTVHKTQVCLPRMRNGTTSSSLISTCTNSSAVRMRWTWIVFECITRKNVLRSFIQTLNKLRMLVPPEVSSLAVFLSMQNCAYDPAGVFCLCQKASRAARAATLVVTFGMALVSMFAAMIISGALKVGIQKTVPTTLPSIAIFTAAAVPLSSAALVTLLLARTSAL